MDTLQLYDDHTDKHEEPEEETQKMQPQDFSVNEVEIEDVSVVVETQELVTEEVEVVTLKNGANDEEDSPPLVERRSSPVDSDEEDSLPFVERRSSPVDSDEEDSLPFVERRSSPVDNDLNKFEKEEEESADPGIVPKAEEGLHAPNSVDQVRELVDLNRETFGANMDFTASEGDVVMTDNDEVPVEADTKAMEDADEGTGMLMQTESDGKDGLTFGEVANGHQDVDLDTLGVEADDQQPPAERAPESSAAASDGGSPGQDLEEVPADLTENEEIVDKDANENQVEVSEHADKQMETSEHSDKQMDASEHADKHMEASEHADKHIEASEHADTERECSALNSEDVNDGENDNAQVGNPSASKEHSSAEEGLESAPHREQLFNDAHLAQLQAQILVMGILRKGSKPSDDLLKSACATDIEGTPGATVAEDIGIASVGKPSSSRKRKSRDRQAVASGVDGIATNLMNAVKDNLDLSQSPDALLLDDTYRQLRSAQVSAHDAMATATSALAQSHLAWSQMRSEDHSETGIAREAQIASVAATVAAAASVAKAAVEAAKAIANVSLKGVPQGDQTADGQPSASQSKRESKSSLARKRKSDMLDSVVKAAGMAAEAATQAGTVLAFARPLIQAGVMGSTWTLTAGEGNEVEKKAARSGSRKTKTTPRRKETKRSAPSKRNVSASPKTTPRKVSKDGSKKSDAPARGKTVKEHKSGEKTKPPKTHEDSRQPSSRAKSPAPHKDLVEVRAGEEMNRKSEPIARGSVVEIMTEEVGLRGGWFSGKILKMAKGQAFVVYDEILNDDGSKLEEWFPFKASGNPPDPRRQVRPVHPYNSITGAGSKKRRRVSMGSQIWTTGDHVDGFIQDAWWEGVLVELNDIDESKATVYFPGENDTQTVKVWNLRPSLQWEDGKWVPRVNSTVLENERPKTQGKEGSSSSKVRKDNPVKTNSPKVTTNAKNAKSKEKIEASSHKVDEPLPSRPTRQGKAQDLSAEATKAKSSPKKSQDSRNKVYEIIPSRSTRQGKLQELNTRAAKAKKSSGNLDLGPINKVNEPSPSRSSRKRKGSELTSETKKYRKNPRVHEDSVEEPAPTRSTRSSPAGKKLDIMTTPKDSSGKKSASKSSDKKNRGGKNTRVTNKASQKDVGSVGAPKKLDLNVNTVVLEVTMTKTRGKLKAEEAKKRARRR